MSELIKGQEARDLKVRIVAASKASGSLVSNNANAAQANSILIKLANNMLDVTEAELVKLKNALELAQTAEASIKNKKTSSGKAEARDAERYISTIKGIVSVVESHLGLEEEADVADPAESGEDVAPTDPAEENESEISDTVTQEMLDDNPGLAEMGVKVGDAFEITDPVEENTTGTIEVAPESQSEDVEESESNDSDESSDEQGPIVLKAEDLEELDDKQLRTYAANMDLDLGNLKNLTKIRKKILAAS